MLKRVRINNVILVSSATLLAVLFFALLPKSVSAAQESSFQRINNQTIKGTICTPLPGGVDPKCVGPLFFYKSDLTWGGSEAPTISNYNSIPLNLGGSGISSNNTVYPTIQGAPTSPSIGNFRANLDGSTDFCSATLNYSQGAYTLQGNGSQAGYKLDPTAAGWTVDTVAKAPDGSCGETGSTKVDVGSPDRGMTVLFSDSSNNLKSVNPTETTSWLKAPNADWWIQDPTSTGANCPSMVIRGANNDFIFSIAYRVPANSTDLSSYVNTLYHQQAIALDSAFRTNNVQNCALNTKSGGGGTWTKTSRDQLSALLGGSSDTWYNLTYGAEGYYSYVDKASGKTNNIGGLILKQLFPYITGPRSSGEMVELGIKPAAGDKATNTNNSSTDDTARTCGIQGGLGWILCPVASFLSSMADAMWGFIADQLEIKSDMVGVGPGTYTAWQVFRDYANIAFIIAFLFIVYSQITSVGITNYGLKKMLPKLVISAILVNVSYFICQGLVDLSNLLGYGIKGLFDSVALKMTPPAGLAMPTTGSDIGIGLLIGGLLVAGTVLIIGLAFSILIPVLIAIALVFFILLLRKVLIIVLIVLAPLAFVAYLLPNTEKWFKKWWTTFMQLLMVFPIIALVMGGSAVASTIIATSGTSVKDDQCTSSTTDASSSDYCKDSQSKIMQLLAVAVLTLPFFLIPGLLKKSLAATGSLGTKLGGIGSGGMKKGAKKGWDNSTAGRSLALSKQSSTQRKNKNFVRRLASGKGIRGKLAQRIGRKQDRGTMQNLALAAVDKEEKDELATVGQDLSRSQASLPDLRALATGANSVDIKDSSGNVIRKVNGGKGTATQHAAIQKIVAAGDIAGISALINSAHTMSPETRKILADSLEGSQKKPVFVSGGSIGAIRQGTEQNSEELVRGAINKGSYSTEKIARAEEDEVSMVATVLASTAPAGATALNAAAVADVKAASTKALTDPRFGAAKTRSNLRNIESGHIGDDIV